LSDDPSAFARYRSVADIVLKLDPKNPQVAARIMGAFRSWRAREARRRPRAEATLRRVAATPNLSERRSRHRRPHARRQLSRRAAAAPRRRYFAVEPAASPRK
jgi:hypothetical protein